MKHSFTGLSRLLLTLITVTALTANVVASDSASSIDCRGSRKPYQAPQVAWHYPDSLTPVMINHVGRHGARYATSPAKIRNVINWLSRADSAGTISPEGKKMLALARKVQTESDGRWGQLDSIGIAEQEGIAQRMYTAYRPVFIHGAEITAMSSYVPRCVMSMYAFCHKLSQMNDQMTINTSSGPMTSPLMRPFELDSAFIAYSKNRPFLTAMNPFKRKVLPSHVARDMMGRAYRLSDKQADNLTADIYYLVSGCSAIGIDVNPADFFSVNDYYRMWNAANTQQCLSRTATDISSVPAIIAADLAMNLVTTTQDFIDGSDRIPVHLRFGHAETLMPLLSLLKIQGCHTPEGCPVDSLSAYWQNSSIIPMAANLQMILLRSATGRYYVSVMLNEQPVALIPDSQPAIISWSKARAYIISRIPAN